MGNVLSADEREELLREAPFMRLATIGPDGSPHCVPMWFGYIDGRIYFKTLRHSVKARNIERDKRIALTVDLGQSYFDLRGLSIVGEAHRVTDMDLQKQINDDWVSSYLGPHHPMVEGREGGPGSITW